MDHSSPIKLVVVGQTPPPYNGQAKMIQVLVEGLSESLDISFVRMDFSDSVSTAGKFSIGKIIRLFSLIGQTWKALGLKRDHYLYYPPASPNLIPVFRDILFLLLVRPFCKGLVLHFHAGGVSLYAQSYPVLRPLMRLVYGAMDLGIVNGESCPDDPTYFRAKHTAVIPHGIDVPARLSHLKYRKSDGCLRILYVGIHTEEKGLFTLLETARILRDRGVSILIHTVGKWYGNEEESKFVKMRSELNLDDFVINRGVKIDDALWQEYEWANVLFFPTHYPWETMGIVQLEAMAHSLPVVASDWQGPKDVVIEGETGFLCPPHDPAAFATVFSRLAEDQELCRKMGVAGRKKYGSYYTEAHFIDRINNALDSSENS